MKPDSITTRRKQLVIQWLVALVSLVVLIVCITLSLQVNQKSNALAHDISTNRAKVSQIEDKNDQLIKVMKSKTFLIDKTHNQGESDPVYQRLYAGLTDMFSWKDWQDYGVKARETRAIFVGTFADKFFGNIETTQNVIKYEHTHRLLRSLTITRFENGDFYAKLESAPSDDPKRDSEAVATTYHLRVKVQGDKFELIDLGQIGDIAN